MVGMRWQNFGATGTALDDASTLYIIDAPSPAAGSRWEVMWFVVQRRSPHMKPEHVAGPFPTKDAAKAAYIILAPHYPGP